MVCEASLVHSGPLLAQKPRYITRSATGARTVALSIPPLSQHCKHQSGIGVTKTSTVNIGGCSCSAGSFGLATLTGTLVLSGAEGNVDVTISALQTLLRQVSTDAFGLAAESGTFMDLFVNGSPVFSLQIEAMNFTGPNGSSLVQAVSQISRTITLQGGTSNTISVRLSTTSLAINEVPEPASVVLLMSGLGFMTGVFKRRRDRNR